MKTNGATTITPVFPRDIPWRTAAPIRLAIGPVTARGQASPQLRSPDKLAALGDLPAQVGHIQAGIIKALARVLQGMEPSAAQLTGLRRDISAATLIRANQTLSTCGVALLGLWISELSVTINDEG